MINPRELRIGNLVDGGHGKPLYYAIKESDFAMTDFNLTKPIPLTSEILLKSGFKYGSTGDKDPEDNVEFWDREAPEQPHDFAPFYFSIVRFYNSDFQFSHQSIRSPCKYVHQLQNLHFALTGQELKINF